MLISAAAGD